MKYICSKFGGLSAFQTKANRQHTQFMINHKIDEKIMLMTMAKEANRLAGRRVGGHAQSQALICIF